MMLRFRVIFDNGHSPSVPVEFATRSTEVVSAEMAGRLIVEVNVPVSTFSRGLESDKNLTIYPRSRRGHEAFLVERTEDADWFGVRSHLGADRLRVERRAVGELTEYVFRMDSRYPDRCYTVKESDCSALWDVVLNGNSHSRVVRTTPLETNDEL